MMTAFCYASTFLPAHLPTTVFVIQRLDEDKQGIATWIVLVCVVQGIYLVSLLLSMARYNYIEGPHLRSFMIITLVLTLVTGVITGAALGYAEDREREIANDTVDWNVLSRDHQTLLVSNSTRNRGCTDCWAPHVEANVGEVVSFEIYYHHTSAVVARDTRARLMLPSVIERTGIVGAEVWARNSPRRAAGAVSVIIRSNEPVTLQFVGGKWYQGQNDQGQSMASGPLPISTPSEIWSDTGMPLGDVLSGWKHQGNIIVRFLVVQAHRADG
jgi:hypothetical protein